MLIDEQDPTPTSSIRPRRALIVSDGRTLARLIAINLADFISTILLVDPVTFKIVAPDSRHSSDWPDWPDLLILALAAAESEPLVVLAVLNLLGWAGQVPILVISEQPFRPVDGVRIHHLSLPFSRLNLQLAIRALGA